MSLLSRLIDFISGKTKRETIAAILATPPAPVFAPPSAAPLAPDPTEAKPTVQVQQRYYRQLEGEQLQDAVLSFTHTPLEVECGITFHGEPLFASHTEMPEGRHVDTTLKSMSRGTVELRDGTFLQLGEIQRIAPEVERLARKLNPAYDQLPPADRAAVRDQAVAKQRLEAGM